MTKDGFAVLSRAFRRRKTPAPAASPRPVPGNTPVPGHTRPQRPPLPPERPAPAPAGLYGPLELVVYHYASGWREHYDPDGFPIHVEPPPPAERPDAFDLWYRAVCAQEDQ